MLLDESLNKMKEKSKKYHIQPLENQAVEKPLRLTDLNREMLLSGKVEIDEDAGGPKEKTHVQEQEELKQALKNAVNASGDVEEEDDLFTVRQKSEEEIQRDEDEYRRWLLDQLKADKTTRTAFEDWLAHSEGKEGKSKYDNNNAAAKESKKKSKPAKNLDGGERFLMEYVLNRGWVDPLDKIDVSEDESHNDLLQTGAQASVQNLATIEEIDPEDDVDKAEEFETQYNFRFEQLEEKFGTGSSYGPNARNLITTHARVQPDSVRRPDTRRAEARQAREERCAAEKEAKVAGLKRMKALKKKEIEDMVEKLAEVAGLEEDDMKMRKRLSELVEKELEDGDFDLDKWDNVMEQLFNDDYYDQKEKKPVFEDSDAEESEERVPAVLSEIETPEAEESQSGIHELSDQNNDVKSIPKDQTVKLKKLLEEYDQLAYEDIVAGDIKTRFHYKKVNDDDYGLKPEEILMADDDLLDKVQTSFPFCRMHNHGRFRELFSVLA